MLNEKLKNYQIYLASHSPRRQELIKKILTNFNIALKINVEENYCKSLYREEIPMYLAQKKSDAYTDILKQNRILITADTIVWQNEQLFGKPKNINQATEMLKKLSGKSHEVITAITLRDKQKMKTFFDITEVWFKKISSKEIEYYITNFKPYDKAGAYGIQEWIGHIAIEKIHGSYYNVVGMPIQKLYVELNKFIDNKKI